MTPDFIPGYGDASIPPFPVDDVAAVQEQIDETQKVADEIASAATTSAEAELVEIEGICADIQSSLCGEVGITISNVEGIVSKIQGKMTTDAVNGMEAIYTDMNLLGLNIPTQADIEYANTTGDYLGSVTGSTPAIGGNDSVPVESETSQGLVPTGTTGQDEEPQASPVSPVVRPDEKPDTNSPTPASIPAPHPRVQWQPGPIIDPNGGLHWTNCNAMATHGWMENPGFQWWPPNYMQIDATWPNPPLMYPPVMLHEGEECPYGSEGHCIDACHFGENPGSGHVRLCIPPHLKILINPATGEMLAVGINNTLEFNGWVYAHAGNCNTPQFFVTSSGPPGTVPPPPPSDPGTCKPVCPTNKPPACPPNVAKIKPPEMTEAENWCDLLKRMVESWEKIAVDGGNIFGMGSEKQCEGQTAGQIAGAIMGGQGPIIPGTVNSFGAWATAKIKELVNSANCNASAMLPYALWRAALAFLDKWVGAVPPQLMILIEQMGNTICQMELPGVPDADRAYMHGKISQDIWECWVKAAGHKVDEAKLVRDSGRVKPDPLQVSQLFRREEITQEEFLTRMRENGVIEDSDKDVIHKMTKAWPGISDVIRFMVRDVADTTAVENGKLDDQFPDKWKDKLKKLGDALGIEDDLAKYYWRAHWELPSYTQAQLMLFRLDDPQLGPDLHFDIAKMRELLRQDDHAPGYVDRLIEIAYHPINTSDAIKAFYVYASDDATFRKQLMHQGYKADNADFMVQYHKKVREINDKRRAGYPSISSLAQSYARCEIDNGTFRNVVAGLAYSEEHERFIIEAANVRKKITDNKLLIKAVRRPFMLGVIDQQEAVQKLSDGGMDGGCINGLVEKWELERMKRDKYASAAQLCKWRENALIGASQQLKALVKMGWSSEDALRIVTQCGMEIEVRATQKMERQAAKAAAAAEKARKEAEKLRRLAECGPPPCPANRRQNNPPGGGAGQGS